MVGDDRDVLVAVECLSADFDSSFAGACKHLYDGGNTFPCHGFRPFNGSLAIRQERSIPMIFQDAPNMFHRIVCAMMRWIVNQVNVEWISVREFNHPLDELPASASQFRPMIEIDHQVVDMSMLILPVLPPILKTIDDEITGFAYDVPKRRVNTPLTTSNLPNRTNFSLTFRSLSCALTDSCPRD